MGIDAPVRHATPWATAHVGDLINAVSHIDEQLCIVEDWGASLARRLTTGGRVLVCGNGGSAALAEHLAAELVGRFATTRRGLSALALSTDGSVVTALMNDFGSETVFARQVEAHGRAGDVLLLMSTSGRSPDLLGAVATGRDMGLATWAMTGPTPNPLAGCCDEVASVDAPMTTVQEVQQMLVHVLAQAVDVGVEATDSDPEPERR
jgi:phosphoheptose isomerase